MSKSFNMFKKVQVTKFSERGVSTSSRGSPNPRPGIWLLQILLNELLRGQALHVAKVLDFDVDMGSSATKFVNQWHLTIQNGGFNICSTIKNGGLTWFNQWMMDRGYAWRWCYSQEEIGSRTNNIWVFGIVTKIIWYWLCLEMGYIRYYHVLPYTPKIWPSQWTKWTNNKPGKWWGALFSDKPAYWWKG